MSRWFYEREKREIERRERKPKEKHKVVGVAVRSAVDSLLYLECGAVWNLHTSIATADRRSEARTRARLWIKNYLRVRRKGIADAAD